MAELHIDIRKTVVDSRGRSFALRAQFSSSENFVVLFGPSGSGKSLTLQAVAGLLHPDGGLIRIGERCLFDSVRGIDLPIQQRRVGYLFQDYALFPHMSVLENIAVGLKPWWRPGLSAPVRERVAQMLEVFELGAQADALPRDLSGGQRQRVALARALAKRPDLLLLDEPFAALNPLLRARMRAELLRIRSHFDVPVILITHDQEDVSTFADTLVVYDQGSVQQVWPFSRLRQAAPAPVLSEWLARGALGPLPVQC